MQVACKTYIQVVYVHARMTMGGVLKVLQKKGASQILIVPIVVGLTKLRSHQINKLFLCMALEYFAS